MADGSDRANDEGHEEHEEARHARRSLPVKTGCLKARPSMPVNAARQDRKSLIL